jgi:ribosome biogenesis GTPase A
MTIQWFPGHMAKARRQVTEKLKMIDVVIELLDARIPLASRNPMIDEIVKEKPRLILLNKTDLADSSVTESWISYFRDREIYALAVDSLTGRGIYRIPDLCRQLTEPVMEKRRSKGMNDRSVRTMILGIPNVGKSSLINRLANKRVTQTGDRPAVTKAQQWVKVANGLDLLDTPGILWPKFEDSLVGLRLAASGAIKDEILDLGEVALFVLEYLRVNYSEQLKERFKLQDLPNDRIELLGEIGKKRGCIMGRGQIDYDKTSELLLRELRSGKMGAISLERPQDKFSYKTLDPEGDTNVIQ